MSFSTRGSTQGKMGVVGHAGFTLIGTGIGAILVLGTELMTVRFLSPNDYGFFAIAFVLAKSGGVVAAFGLRLTVIHFIPLHRLNSQSALLVGTVIAAIGFPLLLGIVMAGGLWILADWIAVDIFSKPGAAPFIGYAALLIPFGALIEVLGHIPRAFDRSLEQVLVRSLIPPAAFAIILVVLMLTHAPPISVVIGLVFAHVAATIVGFAFVGALLRPTVKAAGRPVFELKRLYLFSLPIVVNDLVQLGLSWSDILVLGLYAEPDQIGIYRVCIQIGQLFFLLQNAVAAATAPLYSVLAKANDRRQLQFVYGTGLRLLALCTAPTCLIVLFNAEDILRLFNPAFEQGATALMIRTVGQGILTYFGLAGVLLVTSGHPRVEMANGLIALVCGVALNFALIPHYGIEGASIAFLFSVIVITVLRLIKVHRTLGVRSMDLRLPRVMVLSGLSVGSVALIAPSIGLAPGEGLLIMGIRIAMMGVVAAGSLWLIEVNPRTRDALKRLLRIRPQPSVAFEHAKPGEAEASRPASPPHTP